MILNYRFEARRWAVVYALGLLGCSGGLSGQGSSGDAGGSTGLAGPTPAGDVGAMATRPMAAGAAAPAVAPLAVDTSCQALPARVWRLSHEQYRNSLKQAFGVEPPSTRLSPDAISKGFTTDASTTYVSDTLFAQYNQQAERMAARVVEQLPAEQQCVLESPDEACVQGFVKHYAERAYRRPLEETEQQKLASLFNDSVTQHSAREAAEMVLAVIMQSPKFLYRGELGVPSTIPEQLVLTPFEVASLVSYTVADVPPDEPLLEAAHAAQLDSAEALLPHVQRLLALPEARVKLGDFFSQYLHIEQLLGPQAHKDEELFPDYDDDLARSMVEETLQFAQHTLLDVDGGGYASLLTAPYSLLNQRLAEHYGIDGAALGEEFERVELPAGERAGLLTQGSLLALHAGEASTSPVHRGLFVYDKLLCQPIPSPPANAQNQTAKLRGPSEDLTEREHFEYALQTAPDCTACHNLFQPMGLAFESYDAVGRYREEQHGKPLVLNGELMGHGDADGAYANGIQLAANIAHSATGQQCFIQQYLTYALGANLDGTCRAEQVHGHTAAPLDLASILAGAVHSQDFFIRSASVGEGP